MAVNPFPNVRSCGNLLPLDTQEAILERRLDGLKDEDFHLVGERQTEAINNSWRKMLAQWQKFSDNRKNLAPTEAGTGITREHLLLPLFQELGYGRLSLAREHERQLQLPNGAVETFPISHFRDECPIHLTGCNVSLDQKARGVTGAAKESPHSLVQHFLNISPGHLWGIVANGLSLRLIRKNASLSNQTYVEFSLEGIFEGQSFREYALLWLCCHHSRIHCEDGPPEKCWLEQWNEGALDLAVKVLDNLRLNVADAITILANGFLAANPPLRSTIARSELSAPAYFRELLRLAYRLIFLLVVEERGLLHGPDAPHEAVAIYNDWWSLSRLCRLGRKIRGDQHHDLWEGLKILMDGLSNPSGCPPLGLAPMGGFLWSREAICHIAPLQLRNFDLLSALRQLSNTHRLGTSRPVDWRNLGALELGSIYESLLELNPAIENDKFALVPTPGNERKTTGSYYTPTPLIDNLVQSALVPVIERAMREENPELALLKLKICDPACGSGHFLLAAAKAIAKRLAQFTTGDAEPTAPALAHALGRVVGNCIYGMDINPMSVELCKVGLWLETHEPGKPLNFIDHHILCANSLIGATGEAIANGIPGTAYTAMPGSEPEALVEIKKRNRTERKDAGETTIPDVLNGFQSIRNLVKPPLKGEEPADTLAEVQWREQQWREWLASPEWQKKKFLYDLWTAAFFLPAYFPETGRVFPDGTREKNEKSFGITWNTLAAVALGRPIPEDLQIQVQELAARYNFFHWQVMFPEVEAKGGFDVILGNPPWERLKLQEKEWFALYPEIAKAPNAAARAKEIAKLENTDPELFSAWEEALARTTAQSHFLRNSSIYPLCGRGDITLYTVFAEWMRKNLNINGRMGAIVPSGIATDDTTKFFFRDLLAKNSLVSLYDFENGQIFPDVHASYKFSLLTAGSGSLPITDRPQFVFFAHDVADLAEKRFSLSQKDIALLNPNTGTCPIFRSRRDMILTRAIYRRVPVLIRESGVKNAPVENPWNIRFSTMFHMSNDSKLFHTREQLVKDGWELQGNIFVKNDECMLPLYEAKMVQPYNHRAADVMRSTTAVARQAQPRTLEIEELQQTDRLAQPLYWVEKKRVEEILEEMKWKHHWLMGWRDITSASNRRTLISGIIPLSGVGDKFLLLFADHSDIAFCLNANWNSFVVDYAARQKIGGTSLKFFTARQLPTLPPATFSSPTPWQPEITLADWLKPKILELTYTAEDMRPFALDLGYDGEPFIWDEERRAQLKAEIDAAFFHLYLPSDQNGNWERHARESEKEHAKLVAAFPTPGDAVEYIMETFPITRKKDLERTGRYVTKERVLAEYGKLGGNP